MKESVTKFDLEAAFKALDEIDIPNYSEGIRANRPALTEIFSKKTKLDALLEDYYDISNTTELSDAKDARDAEVAKAKLARIEKIVDLDAESPEDLLVSYVGKIIVQCPQCMTLFYKNPEDIVEDENDQTNVNVNEVCQHCGNETGYTLIGKVGEVTPEETENYEASEEHADEKEVTDVDVQSADEEAPEAEELDLDNLEDPELDLEIEDDEAEAKEESFEANFGTSLTEGLTEDAKEDGFDELLNSEEFKKPISDAAVRAMMNELGESKKNFNVTENISTTEFPAVAGFDYKVTDTFEDGGLKGNNIIYSKDGIDFVEIEVWGVDDPVVVLTNLYAPNLMQPIYDSFDAFSNDLKYKVSRYLKESVEQLTEGPFSKLKDKISGVIKNTTNALKSREAKANWILENSLKDGAKVSLDETGQNLDIKQEFRRFHKFAVLGFTGKYNDGSVITISPYADNDRLVAGMKEPVLKSTYQEADAIAKAWSMRQGNGPAFIYLVQSADDENAAFLCSYFEGNLDTKKDMLEKYFETVQKDLEGAKIEAKAAAEIAEKDNDAEAELRKQGVETNTTGAEATQESLQSFINELENLQEASLEQSITDYLIENYDNIAGFRLDECTYSREGFSLVGKSFLTEGTTKATTFTFKKAKNQADKVILEGLSTGLDASDRAFILTGAVDTSSKTFITESFNHIK